MTTKEDKISRALILASRHIKNARDCASHVRHNVKKYAPDSISLVESGIDGIDKLLYRIRTEKSNRHIQEKVKGLSIGKGIYFTMSPMRILDECIAELKRAYKNLQFYYLVGHPELDPIIAAIPTEIRKWQEIKKYLRSSMTSFECSRCGRTIDGKPAKTYKKTRHQEEIKICDRCERELKLEAGR